MAKKFPKTLFVKIESDNETDYFVADEDGQSLAEMGEKIKVARYELKEVLTAEGTVTLR